MTSFARNVLIIALLVIALLAVTLVAGRQLLLPAAQPQVVAPAQPTAVTPTPTAPMATITRSAATLPQPAAATPDLLPAASTSTVVGTPTTPAARTPGPTVAPDLALEFTTVQPNQFLGSIAAHYGVSVEELAKFSEIDNPDLISIGQGLIIPHRTQRYTPAGVLLPNSELVYGVAYQDFDLHRFVASQPGYLASFSMLALDGGRWSGADVVERVAMRFSVGPRVLLAMLEARGGWLSNPEPDSLQRDYPAGHTMGAPGLLAQLEWAADELNRGFYGWLDRGETAIRFQDGIVARGEPGLNPATVAIQRALAVDSSYSEAEEELAAFVAAYRRLFGDPMALDAGPVLPADLEQPKLQLPWPAGEQWYITGGPHGGWASGSGWAALDFVPEQASVGACEPAEAWAVAAADGVVARNDGGEILLDLDGDGDVRTGWVIQYLHMSDRTPAGVSLRAGERVGRPSCEGGAADATHLHIARRYNGLWAAASGPVPFVMDGWTPQGRFEYEGKLTKPGVEPRVACDCRRPDLNGITWQPEAARDSTP